MGRDVLLVKCLNIKIRTSSQKLFNKLLIAALKQILQVFYHEGVSGEEVPAWHSGSPGWCVRVRGRWPSTEPAADCPDYKDSGGVQRMKRCLIKINIFLLGQGFSS